MLAAFKYKFVNEIRWSPDDRGLVMLYHARPNLDKGQVGYVAYPDGAFHPIARDTNSYSTLTVSSDFRRYTRTHQRRHSNLQQCCCLLDTNQVPKLPKVPYRLARFLSQVSVCRGEELILLAAHQFLQGFRVASALHRNF